MRDERFLANQNEQSWEFFPTTNVAVADDFDDTTNANSSDEVLAEIGLVLVIILDIVLAINMMLVALHIG